MFRKTIWQFWILFQFLQWRTIFKFFFSSNYLFHSHQSRKQNATNSFLLIVKNEKVNCIIAQILIKNNNNERKNVQLNWKFEIGERKSQLAIKNWYLTNLWHLVPINAAIMLQYSHADGFPYCLTLYSHFLQMVDVLLLL